MSRPLKPSAQDLFFRIRSEGLDSEGGRAAAESLIRLFEKPVEQLCRRVTRRRDEAEDVFQETFLQLLLRAEEDDTMPRRLGAYIHGIVRNQARALARRSGRTPGGEAAIEAADPSDPTEATLVGLIDAAAHLAVLPPRMRRVVVATLLEGRKAREIAEDMGITEENVRQLRSRALHMLRAVGVDLPGSEQES